MSWWKDRQSVRLMGLSVIVLLSAVYCMRESWVRIMAEQRMQEEARVIASLEAQTAQQSSLISRLQTQLVLATRPSTGAATPPTGAEASMMELEKIAVTFPTASGSAGKVIHIDPEWQFVVLNLGWDTVAIGDVLGVVRQGQLVAEVQVERVQEDAAA